jgi:hypothetical protein
MEEDLLYHYTLFTSSASRKYPYCPSMVLYEKRKLEFRPANITSAMFLSLYFQISQGTVPHRRLQHPQSLNPFQLWTPMTELQRDMPFQRIKTLLASNPIL